MLLNCFEIAYIKDIIVTFDRYSLFGRIPIGVKIKVHNVFYTHTSIYSKLILSTDGSKYR